MSNTVKKSDNNLIIPVLNYRKSINEDLLNILKSLTTFVILTRRYILGSLVSFTNLIDEASLDYPN